MAVARDDEKRSHVRSRSFFGEARDGGCRIRGRERGQEPVEVLGARDHPDASNLIHRLEPSRELSGLVWGGRGRTGEDNYAGQDECTRCILLRLKSIRRRVSAV